MPLLMLMCFAPESYVASTNCNVVACATTVTLVTGVAHPSFIYYCCALLCFVRNSFKTIRGRRPTQDCREYYPPSHPMNCMTLYGGFYTSYDQEGIWPLRIITFLLVQPWLLESQKLHIPISFSYCCLLLCFVIKFF